MRHEVNPKSIRTLCDMFINALDKGEARMKKLRMGLEGMQELCKHPDAKKLGSTHGGDVFQCPDCKKQFH
jgi:hypothetical protein